MIKKTTKYDFKYMSQILLHFWMETMREIFHLFQIKFKRKKLFQNVFRKKKVKLNV